MEMDWAVRVEGVGKRYPVRGPIPFTASFRDDATRWVRRILSGKSSTRIDDTGTDNGSSPEKHFWALRDIHLETNPGEVLGIIGRNGAGKSTLLKILARITPPTRGRIRYRGRLGSLLDIGTGFHRELTGRENIFLNGSVLGMRRGEVAAKLDEIVAFAEIDKFIDTPVKFYSSGMYIRLAFAVAAHLDTDILLVDEVLAVGDVRFQKKCLSKMAEATGNEGRAVLFVSHNMNAVQRLCSRAVFLEQGQIAGQGKSQDVVMQYLSACGSQISASGAWIDLSAAGRLGTGRVRFAAVRYSSDLEVAGFQPYSNGPVEFSLVITAQETTHIGSIAVTFYTLDGTKLVNADSISLGTVIHLREGRNELSLRIKQLHLTPGNYLLGLYLASPLGYAFDHIEAAFEITVADLETNKLGQRPVKDGLVSCDFEVVEVHHHADSSARD
jgi:lipopolysaccharide transport system ATP-binding protein